MEKKGPSELDNVLKNLTNNEKFKDAQFPADQMSSIC